MEAREAIEILKALPPETQVHLEIGKHKCRCKKHGGPNCGGSSHYGPYGNGVSQNDR